VRYMIAAVAIFLISGCGLLFSSYDEKSYNEITVFPSNVFGRYALKISFHVTRRGGNVHDFNNLSKYEEDRAEWLYLHTLQGKITDDGIVTNSSPTILCNVQFVAS
jgi:hypothetical protein